MSAADLLLLHGTDDVYVALRPLSAGETVVAAGERPVIVGGDVPVGHKLARRSLASGELVRKYGQIIGAVTEAVSMGGHMGRTLYDGIFQIPPGHFLIATEKHVQLNQYWDFDYPTKENNKPKLRVW